ncbi:MAG: molybdenum cofactor guanylyltransferase [Immundisolibacteraceae bacterium]|nr:molybdenum cofactor guanylyltransferase [Immundisolibacteraceae bacterium]
MKNKLNTPQPDSVTGLILAGGRSSRFNGLEKGLIDFNGQPMIARVSAVFRHRVDQLIICANCHHQQYQPYADQVISDWVGNQWGPLAGIYTGLLHCKTNWLLVATCDQPLLPENYVSQLVRQCDGNSVLIAADPDRQHYLNMLVHVSNRIKLRDYLMSGRRSVKGWLNVTRYQAVHFPERLLDSVNSVEQLHKATDYCNHK